MDVFITDLVGMSNRMGYNPYTFMLSHGGLNMICSQTDEIFDYTHMQRFEKTVLCCDSGWKFLLFLNSNISYTVIIASFNKYIKVIQNV